MSAQGPGRVGALELREVDGARHLQILASNGRSDDVNGRIESQYEAKLRAGDPTVGAFGLEACGRLVGSLSWGEVNLPAGRGVSGRLDTVVSRRTLRGYGIGALLMAEFVRLMFARFGQRLVHLSTIAVHPSVAHSVGALGFRAENLGETPLFQVDLRATGSADVAQLARRSRQRRLSVLKQRCVKCTSRRWVRPWCEPPGTTP